MRRKDFQDGEKRKYRFENGVKRVALIASVLLLLFTVYVLLHLMRL